MAILKASKIAELISVSVSIRQRSLIVLNRLVANRTVLITNLLQQLAYSLAPTIGFEILEADMVNNVY